MRVAIAGSSGLIGTALKESLHAHGHETLALVRREPKGDQSRWDPTTGLIDAEALLACDVVINLAGASIGDRRLTPSYQRFVRESRVQSTALIASTLAQGWHGVLIQGSAMGYYGDRREESLTERSDAGDSFLAGMAKDWEHAAAPVVDAGVRTVFIRSGLVLAPFGGFADRLLPLVRRGLLGKLGSGRAWHAWISLEDEVRAIEFLIASDHHGPANLVAPAATRDADLIAALCRAAGKRPGFGVPAWSLELVIGQAIDDLLASQNARPGVLTRLGFEWHHPSIASAAAWVMEQAGFAPPSIPETSA